MSDVEQQVLAFFEQRGIALGDTREEQLGREYLDEGLLDSMGIVAMVLDFEREFGISFAPEDMQSVEFRTVGGLVQLIAQRVGG